MGRYDITRQIEALDGERDHVRIYHLLVGYEFPWDFTRALELALYRTFCVPSISALLDRTGEFGQRPQRRYDDTALMVAELCEHGYDSERGRETLRRMNRVHGQFKISNDDYLYVLSTFIYEPARWLERYGWRALTPKEQHACYAFWREVGRRMNIRDIPPSYAEFQAWAQAFEAKHFAYSEANARVGGATRDLFLSWMPAPVRPLARQVVYALLDDTLLKAFGFPRPPAGVRALADGALRLRGWAVAHLPARTKPAFVTHAPARSYPQGYQLDDLGPPEFVAKLRAERAARAEREKSS